MALCFGGQDLQPRPDLLFYLNNLVYCVKGLKRYGAGCKPAPAKNVTEQVANLLRQKTLRSRLQTCSGKIANLLRQRRGNPLWLPS
jgi:hypothetical protein